MLMNLSPDRLLAPFYEAAGKTPKALRYGGWESKGISGHTLGHYLTALSLMYESTGEEKAKERALYVVDELDSLQDGEGYVCGFPKKQGFMGVFDNPEAFNCMGRCPITPTRTHLIIGIPHTFVENLSDVLFKNIIRSTHASSFPSVIVHKVSNAHFKRASSSIRYQYPTNASIAVARR